MKAGRHRLGVHRDRLRLRQTLFGGGQQIVGGGGQFAPQMIDLGQDLLRRHRGRHGQISPTTEVSFCFSTARVKGLMT